jgi:hypothetical protein
MRGNVPDGPLVANWFAANGGELTNRGIQFLVRRGEEIRLGELATAFRSIVRPGVRYTVSSYKYVCPRVASAIERIQQVLHGGLAAELNRVACRSPLGQR